MPPPLPPCLAAVRTRSPGGPTTTLEWISPPPAERTSGAAKSGVVLTSTYNSSYGNYVVISHANGESTLYAHMSKRLVSEGDKVTQGQTIGLVGTTGSSTGNHLHFEVRLNGQRQDPLNYFRGSTFTLRASGKSVSYTVS